MLHTSRILRTGKEARQAAAEATVQEPASHAVAEGQLAMAGAGDGDGDERRRKRVGLEFFLPLLARCPLVGAGINALVMRGRQGRGF